MSIRDLCVGDVVRKQEKGTATVGRLGGDATQWAAEGSDIDCRIDSASSEVIERYKARGLKVTHQAMFPDDQSLTAADRLRWVSTQHGTALTDYYLKVQGYYKEDTPYDDPDMRMWIADCDFEETRNDQAEASA